MTDSVSLDLRTDSRPLLTLADIASRFHFSESSARRLAADDSFPLPAMVMAGNRRFWSCDDIENYARAHGRRR